MPPSQPRSRPRAWARRAARVEPGEEAALAWSFLYFFSLLGGYYVLKPLREEAGIVGGVENLQWLYAGTFAAMLVAVPLYSALVSRLPRRVFVPVVHVVFAACLLGFRTLLDADDEAVRVGAARAFFVWTSVYNLFVVSVFWGVLADVLRPEQGERLFGPIAAGGSLGALAGSWATGRLAGTLGVVDLLWIPVALLGVATACVLRLGRVARRGGAPPDAPVGGGVLAGFTHVARSPYLLGICAYLLAQTTCSTFVYFQQAALVAERWPDDPAARTALFADVNLVVQALTLVLQGVVAARVLSRLGAGVALGVLPAIYACGFVALAVSWTLPVVVVLGILRQAATYGLAGPARQVLFTVVPREDKYKAKSFVDTVVYRGGDAAAAWTFAGLAAALPLAGPGLVALPLCAAWLGVAGWLGRRERERAARGRAGPPALAAAPPVADRLPGG